ncbi:hypothetical protein MnBA_37620 [Marinobacterium sp. BA1]
MVWRADYDAFGQAAVAPGSILTFNLRFPGQYFDSETGLHYNYYRDYDPSTGRYIQSDPRGILLNFSDPQRRVTAQMGLPIPGYGYVNGLNHLYGYTGQNSLMYIDPTGETPATAAGGAAIGGTIGGPPSAVVGGVIGFGVGWWAASEFWDWYDNKDNPSDDSQESKKDRCIERCSDSALPTSDNWLFLLELRKSLYGRT